MDTKNSRIIIALLLANIVISSGALWYALSAQKSADSAANYADEAATQAAAAKDSADNAFEAADHDRSSEALGKILQQGGRINEKVFIPPGAN